MYPSDTLNSPQGDGNDYIGARAVLVIIELSDTLNSPQGDGNGVVNGSILNSRACQTPSIPRKGTETSSIISLLKLLEL